MSMPSLQRRRWCLGAAAGGAALAGAPMLALGAPVLLRYPGAGAPWPEWDVRDSYPQRLLAAALARTGKAFELRPSSLYMLQGRALRELERGVELEVAWSMTSIEREHKLLPVRIPIQRGLIGWRLPLVMRSRLNAFAQLRGIDDLRKLVAVQGHDWPDLQILRSNGLPVMSVNRYESMFLMLEAGRYDYFPRSAAEIWAEAATHQQKGIVVEPTLVVHYPAAFYFFVHRDRYDLHRLIVHGLELMLADGSFEAMFNETYGAYLRQARLGERRVIELHNPILPPETPLERRQLWYRPAGQPLSTVHR